MQKTILASFEFTGIGLHTGAVCGIRLSPCDSFGFYIKDIAGNLTKIDEDSLSGGVLGTNVMLSNGEAVRTVEHLLSALVSLGITNVVIELFGEEIPIMDGSSSVFVKSLESIGYKELSVAVPSLSLDKPLLVKSGDKWIEITPRSDCMKIFNIKIDFENPVVDKMPQEISYVHTKDNYISHISCARTFGFQNEIEKLLAMKLCIGGSTNNAVVITEDGILNPTGLRFPNELVAHKLLDLIGDLSPALPMLGGFELKAYKPGHMLNNELLIKLMES